MSRLDDRRRRARWIGAAVLTLPVLELIGIILVGRAIGVLGTLLLLVVAGVIGVAVLRRAGAAASRHLLARSGVPDPTGTAGTPDQPYVVGAPPGEPGVGTALLVPAGLLLLVPGFLSDVAGLVLLVPKVRRAVAARLGDAVTRRLDVRTLRAVRVVPGEVVDVQVTDIYGSEAQRSEAQITEVRVTDARRVLPPSRSPEQPEQQ